MQLLHGSGKVRHLADSQVFNRTGRGTINHVGNSTTAILGDNHTLAACRVGITQDRTQVVRVGNPIEQQEEAGIAGGLPAFEQVLKFRVGKRLHGEDRTLMMGLPCQAFQVLALALADRNPALAGQLNQLLNTLTALLFIHKEFEGLATSAQPLTYRVNPIKIIDFHCFTTLPELLAFHQESSAPLPQDHSRQKSGDR